MTDPIIKLKKSSVKDKAPTTLAEGELAVNFNEESPALYVQDTAGNVIKLADAGAAADGKVASVTGTAPIIVDNGDPQNPVIEFETDKYVEIAGDNMTGDLTLGVNRITLDAGTGSITAAGKVTSASTVSSDSGTTLVTKDYLDGGGAPASDLQAVTDAGNTTTNGITTGDSILCKVGENRAYLSPGLVEVLSTTKDTTNAFRIQGGRGGASQEDVVTISTAGSITAQSYILAGPSAIGGTGSGAYLLNAGVVAATRGGSDLIWTGYQTNNSTPTSTITADGSIIAAGGDFDLASYGAISIKRTDGNNYPLFRWGTDASYSGGGIYPDGSITAAGSGTFGGRITAPDIIGDDDYYLTSDYNDGGFLRLTNDVSSASGEAIRITAGSSAAADATIQLFYDGSATFAGLTTHGGGVKVTGGTKGTATNGLFSDDGKSLFITTNGEASAIFFDDGGVTVGNNNRDRVTFNITGNTTGSAAISTGVLNNLTSVGNTDAYLGYTFSGGQSSITGETAAFSCRSLASYNTGSCSQFAAFEVVSDVSGYGTETYGFYSALDNDPGTYAFYSNGSAPSFFQGLTEHFGGINVKGGDDHALLITKNGVGNGTDMYAIYCQTVPDDGTAANVYGLNVQPPQIGVGRTVNGNVFGVNARKTLGQYIGTGKSYGFHSELDSSASRTNYNFYAAGNAPNYFRGDIQSQSNINGDASGAFPGTRPTDTIGQYGFQLQTANVGAVCSFARNGGGGPVIAVKQVASQPLVMFKSEKAGAVTDCGSITVNSASDGITITGLAGGPLIVGEGADARNISSTAAITNATAVVQQLNPVRINDSYLGFAAADLQPVVSEAVIGTADATKAIGTLADYDGTELETAVAEPDDLTYTEEVEATPYVPAVAAVYGDAPLVAPATEAVIGPRGAVLVEAEEAVYGEPELISEAVPAQEATYETVTRTKSWTPTGTQPVYQGVDQTKLIPILVKSLQEALERIEVLEAAAPGTPRKKK